MNIDVKIEGATDKFLKRFYSHILPQAVAIGINKAATHTRAQFVKKAKKDYTMPSASLRENIPIKKASKKDLCAEVTFERQPIPLIQFKIKGGVTVHKNLAKQKAFEVRRRAGKVRRRPVSVMVKKSGGWKELPHHFTAKGKFGASIFRRVGKERFPLKSAHGPSSGGIVKATANFQEIRASTVKTLHREISGALTQALKAAGGRNLDE